MDPWYGLGSHDMLEVAHMGPRVGQMTGRAEMRSCFDAVTAPGSWAWRATAWRPAAGTNQD